MSLRLMRYYVKALLVLIWDFIVVAKPLDILHARKQFRPFLKYQQQWAAHFYPEDVILPNRNVWQYLQKYMMPLINKHASSFHLRGINLLKLDADEQPDFEAFKTLFKSVAAGFEIVTVTDEINPYEYFTLIRNKKFPCIRKLRDTDELFCGNEPDFWHEAIGHLAPLCFPEVQQFYLTIADQLLASYGTPAFENNMAIAWTLMEYGFINENGEDKMFGAALVASHLANMRYLHGLIAIEPADNAVILDSGFYAEHLPIPRDANGRLRFFSFNLATPPTRE